jgi:hypothetical protein
MPRHSVPLAAAALTLAACSDAPLAPSARLTPDATPSAMLGGGGDVPLPTSVSVTLHLVDQTLPDATNSVAGTTVKFTASTGETRTVVDNGIGDGDARPGFYKVAMEKAVWYKAAVVAMPSIFSWDQVTRTASAYATPTLVSMGDLVLLRKPGIAVWLYYKGALVAGQTIRITGPNGYATTIADGGVNDTSSLGAQAPSDGKFEFIRLPTTGTYTVCTLTTPQWMWDTGCRAVDVKYYGVEFPIAMTYELKLVVPKI